MYSEIFAKLLRLKFSALTVQGKFSAFKAFKTISLFMFKAEETEFTKVFLRCINEALTSLKKFCSFIFKNNGSLRMLSLITALSTLGGGKKQFFETPNSISAVL